MAATFELMIWPINSSVPTAMTSTITLQATGLLRVPRPSTETSTVSPGSSQRGTQSARCPFASASSLSLRFAGVHQSL